VFAARTRGEWRIRCGDVSSLDHYRDITISPGDVRYLHNRPSTEDLEYFVNPGFFEKLFDDEKHNIFRQELERLSTEVALGLGYSLGWMNDSVTWFLT
jgi:hypothetical protein